MMNTQNLIIKHNNSRILEKYFNSRKYHDSLTINLKFIVKRRIKYSKSNQASAYVFLSSNWFSNINVQIES